MPVRQRFSPRRIARNLNPSSMLRRQGARIGPGRRLPGARFPGPVPGRVDPLGQLGQLEVRLARSRSEIRRAQNLRYRVFYEEMDAVPDARARQTHRDVDAFDPICDHMLVFDRDSSRRTLMGQKPEIVGTYRLLRQVVADLNTGFYSSGEYDIGPLLDRHSDLNFLELGRSCVLEPYRNKRTVELLWHGNWSYILMHGIDVMFGCASLEGTDPDQLATPLSFLHHHAKAPPEWQVRAVDNRYVDMNRMAPDQIDQKAALKSLPPLVKGYLRLGGFVGDGAVIDHQFGTTDVMVVLPVSAINPRYVNYYGADASRHATPRRLRNLT